eukprot:gene2574-biopygen11544
MNEFAEPAVAGIELGRVDVGPFY